MLLAYFVFPQTNMLKREANNWSIRGKKKVYQRENGQWKDGSIFPNGVEKLGSQGPRDSELKRYEIVRECEW